jgi:hypothetical protein
VSIPQEDLRDRQMEVDGEYQRLAHEHFQYEAELERLSKSPYHSSEDLLQETELKKRKLRIKDRMEQLVMMRARTQNGQ